MAGPGPAAPRPPTPPAPPVSLPPAARAEASLPAPGPQAARVLRKAPGTRRVVIGAWGRVQTSEIPISCPGSSDKGHSGAKEKEEPDRTTGETL